MLHEQSSPHGRIESVKAHDRRRQGQLLAFGMSGAMAVALSACNNSDKSGELMIAPPNSFNPQQAVTVYSTNSPPSAPFVYSPPNNGPYLGGCGYYHVYGFPNYYYRPAPGTAVEFISGGSPNYSAGSAEEANENIARGGFGESAGEGEGEGHGSGEGGHGGGGE